MREPANASSPRRARTVLLGLVVGLLALELGLRVAGLAWQGADARRRASQNQESSEAGRRVLCLGACYTLGIGSDSAESYPVRLQELLRERHPDDDWTVWNASIRAKGLDYFVPRIGALLGASAPSVVVVNVNDRFEVTQDWIDAFDPKWTVSSWARVQSYSRLARLVGLLTARPPTATKETREVSATPSDEMGSTDTTSDLMAQLKKAPQDPELLQSLARLQTYQGNLEQARQTMAELIELRPDKALFHEQMAVTLISLNDYAGAQEVFRRIRTQFRKYKQNQIARLTPTEESREHLLMWTQVQRAKVIYHMTWGGVDEALSAIEEVEAHTSTIDWVHHFKRYLKALQIAEQENIGIEQVEATMEHAPAKPGLVTTTTGRYGLRTLTGLGVEVSEEQAAEILGDLLRRHLGTIQEAAEAYGAPVIVQNMASTPAQQAVLSEVCADLGISVVRIQQAIDEHPDRLALYHPSQATRLSAQGNRVFASEVFSVLEAVVYGQDL